MISSCSNTIRTTRVSAKADNVNANIMGGEMGMGYQLSEHWKTDASTAYSRGKNTSDGRPLPQIPPLEARLGLTYEYGDWSGTGLWRLVSSQTAWRSTKATW